MILSRRPDIERFLSAPPADIRAAVIYGRDRGVVGERAKALAAKVAKSPDDPFDVALLTESDLDSTGRLEGELTAMSLAGGRRLVRLKLTGDRAPPEKAAAEALAGHLAGAFNPDAFFLIEAGALGRDSALRKTGEKPAGCAVIPCYEDETGDVARMAREALAADRIHLDAEALELFVRRLPHERGVARREIERLALYVGPGEGRTVKAAELEPFLGVEPEASLAEAAQDAFGGRPGPAQAGLRRAAQEGDGGPAAVRAVSLHLSRLRRIQVLSRNGASMQEAAKSAGVFWKNEREMLRQARAWTLPDLDALQPDVLSADRACKTTGSPDGLIAERLLLQVAARARRLGL